MPRVTLTETVFAIVKKPGSVTANPGFKTLGETMSYVRGLSKAHSLLLLFQRRTQYFFHCRWQRGCQIIIRH